jgi:thiol-disulfide isomerase/thioredoxin
MRSAWWILLLVALAGCPEKRSVTGPVTRFEAVKASGATTPHWCDASFAGGGPRLTLPSLASPLAGHAPIALPAGRRVWLNLWATWCQPCLRELPLLLAWRTDLHKDGVDVDLVLLSLDADADAFAKFVAEHQELTAARVGRVASQAGYEKWVASYVKDPGAPIPLHLLAGADGRLRCVRDGSLREGDYPLARAALK